MAGPLSILGFEPYDEGSHRAVRESIAARSRHRWTWFTRPGRGWKWRLRLGAVELIEAAEAAGAFRGAGRGQVDAVFATSLLSGSDLRGLLPRGCREAPLVFYFHENQAAYPWSDHPKVDAKRDVHFAITNFTSALAADLAIFNSAYNLSSFLAEMEEIIARASAVELGDWRKRLEGRCRVIWPPVEPPPEGLGAAIAAKAGRALQHPQRVAWPHRWEHDKGPVELLEVATRETDRLDLRWTLLGWQFPERPAELETFLDRFRGRIDHAGFEPDRGRFWERLVECDWVLSTAQHEFFGIAVVESLLAGCLPWLPQRLSYPELLPERARRLGPQRRLAPGERAEMTAAIVKHLEPALAPNAVAAIDDAIEEAVRAAGPR